MSDDPEISVESATVVFVDVCIVSEEGRKIGCRLFLKCIGLEWSV
jgi:hypothetical protein